MTDRKIKLMIFLLVALMLAGCGGAQRGQNVCPIDGAAPQWRGRRNGKSCEYLHYNSVEKQTHSWWADCELAAPKNPSEKDGLK